jgi:hypothetical protein
VLDSPSAKKAHDDARWSHVQASLAMNSHDNVRESS